MEISEEKSKVMVMPRNKEDTDAKLKIKIEDIKLQQVREFKYLGAHLREDTTSNREVKTRLAIATQQLSKMKKIWKCRSISLRNKVNVLRAVVTATALYGCESWTLTAALENRIKAFEMRCFRRLLDIPFTAYKTNVSVQEQIIAIIGQYEPLIEIVRRRKMQWFGHIKRHTGTLSNTILQGYIEGKSNQGRPKTNWATNIFTWTNRSVVECHRVAEDRKRWRCLVQDARMPLRST